MTNQLKVLFISGSLGLGGAEKQLFYCISALSKLNVKVTIIALTKGEPYELKIKDLGIDIIHLNNTKSRFLRLIKITAITKRIKPHIIQSSHTFTNLYAGIAGKRTNTLSIGALRSSFEYSKRVNGRLTEWMIKSPDFIFFNSKTALDETLSLGIIEQTSAQLLHNVITPSLSLKDHPDKYDTFNLIYLGKVQDSKGIDTLLKAYKLLIVDHENTTLTIVGTGPNFDKYVSMAKELGISDRVTFTGAKVEVKEYLSKADIFVFTSLSEGFPNVVIEAMDAGLPVISTPAGDVPVIVKDGVSGYIIDYNAPEQLKERIELFINSPQLIAKYGKAGKQIVDDKFNYKNLGKTILNLYTKAASIKQDKELQKLINTLIK